MPHVEAEFQASGQGRFESQEEGDASAGNENLLAPTPPLHVKKPDDGMASVSKNVGSSQAIELTTPSVLVLNVGDNENIREKKEDEEEYDENNKIDVTPHEEKKGDTISCNEELSVNSDKVNEDPARHPAPIKNISASFESGRDPSWEAKLSSESTAALENRIDMLVGADDQYDDRIYYDVPMSDSQNPLIPDPYVWDQNDIKNGYIYWVVKLYKSKRAEDTDFWLKNLEGELKPGEVLCILSPDDASTRFIDLVSGRCGNGYCSGEIRVGGDAKTGPTMKAGTSYLLDGQVLADFVSVEECLMYTTYFVRPESTLLIERKKMVIETMKELGISSLRHHRIQGVCGRGISRSARVKVNIGNMLLEKKRIIFLDRPAKGLDLIDIEVTVATILDVAKKKDLTVFLSMENPTKALLDNFTKLLILANKQQLYFGMTERVGKFFTHIGHPMPEETSLYDHILELIHDGGDELLETMTLREAEDILDMDVQVRDSFQKDIQGRLQQVLDEARKRFEELQQEFLTVEEGLETREEVKRMRRMEDYLQVQGKVFTPHMTGWLFQVRTLIDRKFKKIFRDPNAYFVELVPIFFWMAIISWWFSAVGNRSSKGLTNDVLEKIYSRDLMNMAAHDIVVALFMALFGVQTFALYGISNAIKEVRLYKSEARSNLYSISAYMASWVFMSIWEQAILIIPYSLCTFYFLGLYRDEHVFTAKLDIELYWYYLSVLVLLATINTLLINVFAFITNNSYITLQCTVGAQLISTLFAGMVVPFPSTGTFFHGLSYISPLKYAFEGLVLEYLHVSSNTNETAAIEKFFLISDEPFVEDQGAAWIALGSFVGLLFIVFVMVPSVQKCCDL